VHCDHEYLNFKGTKLSKSRGAFVEVPYFLSKYDPDALRFCLTATAPETRDTEFSWEDFVERNNNELVATWGNLGQRPWVHGLAVVRVQALRRGGARAGRAGR
jgi:methionyl-tRNA synthetase